MGTEVDRKLDFLVEELKKYHVDIAGNQEINWIGSDVWQSGGSTLLHLGRALPSNGEPARRNEGVGIVLSPSMTAKWKRGGGQWSAVNSRIISARTQVGLKGERLRNGQRRRPDFFVTIVNIYAPTNKAPPHVKVQFREDLQSDVDSASASDVLLMLGDFNARVGSNRLVSSTPCWFDGVANDGALWGCPLGPFWLGACNQAGEGLLMSSNSNELSIMNTNYKKKGSRRGTWTHPATRQSHLIDHIIMRADQRCYCEDVSVVRGAAC